MQISSIRNVDTSQGGRAATGTDKKFDQSVERASAERATTAANTNRMNGSSSGQYSSGAVDQTADKYASQSSGKESMSTTAKGTNVINGTRANNRLEGKNGINNLIDGKAGNDWIVGGDKNDTMYGGDGNDRFAGNLGDDRIFGGSGDDQVYFLGGFGHDTVDGGQGNVDTIALVASSVLGTGPATLVVNGKTYTLNNTEGNSNSMDLGMDATGYITYADGTRMDFKNMERVTW